MRLPSDIAAELIATGLNPAQTALLMELVLTLSTGTSGRNPVESPEYRTLEKRRAWDRDRKQREREAKRASAVSTGHPVESGGKSTGKADVSLLIEEREEGLSIGKERKKGSRLLKDARASDEDRAFAVSAGIPPDRVDAEWTEFVDYWIGVPGSRGVKLDWAATWRNRVRQIAPKYRNRNAVGPNRTNPAAGRATARETELVASVGSGALRYLAESRAARPEREVSASPDAAEEFGFVRRADNGR